MTESPECIPKFTVKASVKKNLRIRSTNILVEIQNVLFGSSHFLVKTSTVLVGNSYVS